MLRIGSLCSGAGALDVAVADVLGDAGTAWVAETDPDASAVLAMRFPDAPNLGDLTVVDWARVEPVDVLVAGFPCQPFSLAGKRRGVEDERWIWPDIARAVRGLRPGLVCLENPAGILVGGGIGRVLGDLAEVGYDARWTSLPASDVGACHRRERVFFVAAPAELDMSLLPTPTASRADRRSQPSRATAERRYAQGRRMLDDVVALLPTPTARDAHRGRGYEYQNGRPLSETIFELLPTPRATDAAKGGPNQRGSSGDLMLPSAVALLLVVYHHADRWAQYGPAIRRWEHLIGRPAPEPTVTGKRGGQRLSGRFTEWMMGWPDGWVSDVVDNNAAVRICGNGVVVQQGRAAFAALAVL